MMGRGFILKVTGIGGINDNSLYRFGLYNPYFHFPISQITHE